MKTCWLLLLSLVCLALPANAGQQPGSQRALSDQQKEGRRLFQQKCAVCHLHVLATDDNDEPYARRLVKSWVDANEDSARRIIANGGPGMPGWKYALGADQIDAVVSYLKTIETPGRTVGARPSEF